MESASCSSLQRDKQVETPGGGITMDELLLEMDVEDGKDSETLLKLSNPDDDDSKAEKDSTDLAVDMEENEPLGNNGEGGEMSPSEPKWLQQDEPIALWVKWRGKWQAGIRCARADWPLTTLRGKPTHDRKKYYVIFFPHTKNYSWADMQLVRSINEFPDPIAYKSHKIGLKMVKDLTAARRYIMRKLTVGMFNIVDQLHSEAVVEAAKDIIVWKESAMEATRSTSYQDLGRMLLKLHSMILQTYVDPIWLASSHPLWVQKCHDAVNAESIELLNEEFYNSVEWNKVKSASNSPMVLSEWKTWKHDIRKWFSISRRTVGEQSGKIVINSDVQATPKRQKLEIRRAETINVSQIESDTLTAIDSETPLVMKDQIAITNTPENGSDLWDGIVVEAGGSQLVKTKVTDELSHPHPQQVLNMNESVERKPFGSGNKSQQCSAFIESKGRQCVRWANEGDVYCCVHLASRFAAKSIKNENSPSVETPMCGGVTVLGTKCKHRSLPGLLFCKKHRPRTGMASSPVKRKLEEITVEPTQYQDLVPFGSSNGTTNLTEMLRHCSQDDNQCVGSFSEDVYVPCNEFSAKHSLYCEQHLPNWLKRARNGKSRIISKEVFVDLLRSCSSREEKLTLHQACDIFYKLFKSVLSLRNSVPMDVQLQWAITEASKDAGAGEFLFKIVSHEKERLTRIWGFIDDEDASFSESPNQLLAITNGCEDEKWSLGGFACAICLDSFVNRKLLESHVEERHHVQFVEKCMLLQCIPCGSHFGDDEQLRLHVQAVHPSSATNNHESSSQIGNSALVVLGDNKESTSGGGVHKYVCKFCGVKFNLLPDLGRHHQAEHMGQSNPVVSRGPKKGLRYNNTYQMKSGRLSRPSKFKKSLGAVSYRIRNRATANMKRRMKSLNMDGTTTASAPPPPPPPPSDFDRSTDAHCSVVSNILFSKVRKTKHRPNNLDILSAAQSACCRLSLEASLEGKFGVLPKRIYLKAARLCGEHGVQVQWHQEGYVCVNGCKAVKDRTLLHPLVPREGNEQVRMDVNDGERCNNELEVDECHCIMEAHHFSKRPFGKKTLVLCDDVSCGKEPVPIRCVVDVDDLDSEKQCERPWESFGYITKSVVNPTVDFVKENLQLRCGCRGPVCSPVTCDHVYLFSNDFEEARDIYGKSMRCRFPYDDKERIILEEGYPVYECNELCRCSSACHNRVLQNGIRVKLEVFKTESKGWGLRACEHILRGTFVCEFVGEFLDQQEANKRRNQYGNDGCSYIQNIDANINDIGRLIEGEPDYVIDATTHGNISRFINHSCSPNLVTHQVIVESMESPLAHIGLYASMDIAAGEEITRDYYRRRPVRSGQEDDYPCLCRASNCIGRLCC